MIRKYFFWLHLAAGSGAGVVIFVMCVTGALLAFERQITNWAERSVRHVGVPAGSARLPLEDLLGTVIRSEGGTPTSVAWHGEADSAVEIGFGRERTVFVNPYSGAPLGGGAVRLRGFFDYVEGLHRWLGANGGMRPEARAITAAANLLFLFLACSGFYLWWPRNWTAAALTNRLMLRGELQGRARDFNRHNAIGFWSCVPLVVMVTCSVVMSYPWANNLVYRLSGSAAPSANAAGRPTDSRLEKSKAVDLTNLNRLSAYAENKVAGWRTISLRLPSANDMNASFTIDAGNGGQPEKRGQLVLSRTGGEEARWEPFASNSRGRRWRIWMRFMHTGEAGGAMGQSVAAVASIGGAYLVYTGISLALRRFFGWRERAKA